MKFTFDTNVLVYAADTDSGDKHVRALDLIRRASEADCFLTLQSLSEFFNATTRRSMLDGSRAEAFVNTWSTVFPVVAAHLGTIREAMTAVRDHRLSFWDAMLWATVREARCRILLTEDFQDGRTLEGVTFVNPFLSHNERLIASALASPAGEP